MPHFAHRRRQRRSTLAPTLQRVADHVAAAIYQHLRLDLTALLAGPETPFTLPNSINWQPDPAGARRTHYDHCLKAEFNLGASRYAHALLLVNLNGEYCFGRWHLVVGGRPSIGKPLPMELAELTPLPPLAA